MQGTVKWFNDAKGFGFIGVKGHADVFVHFSEIRSEGYKRLNEGDEVEFEIGTSPKNSKEQANNVTILRRAEV